jgi:hypothetical protein
VAPTGLILAISGSISAFGVGLGGGLALSNSTASASATQPPPSCFQCSGGGGTGPSSIPQSTFGVSAQATSSIASTRSVGAGPAGSNARHPGGGARTSTTTRPAPTPGPPKGDHTGWEQPLTGTLRSVVDRLPDPSRLSPLYKLLLLIPGATLVFAGGTLYAAVTRDSRRRRREFFDPPSSYSG